MQANSLVGIDLVHIPSFIDKVNQSGNIFLKKIFSTAELDEAQGNMETLAGKFACKEAFIKTLDQQSYQLKDIQILKQNNRPYILFKELRNDNVSITHEHDYAMAAVIRQELLDETA